MIALLKAAKPKVPPAKTEQEEEEERKQNEDLDEWGNPKDPSTLSKLTAEEAEHRALQPPCCRSGTSCARRKP